MIEFGPDHFRQLADTSQQPDWMNLMADLNVHLCSKDGEQWTLDFRNGGLLHMDYKGGTLQDVLKRFEANVTGGVLFNGQPIAHIRDTLRT